MDRELSPVRRLGPPRRLLAVCALALLASLAVAASAAFGADRVYWENSGSLSFANLDGSGGGDLDISGTPQGSPWGMAFDPVTGRVYWANSSQDQIDFTNADGSGGAGQLNTGGAHVAHPSGVAIDPATRTVYWGNQTTNDISYVSLDNPATHGQLSTTGASVAQPSGIAIDTDNARLYFTNLSGSERISYANLSGSGGGDLTISGTTPAAPSGIAIDLSAGRLYWANRIGGSSGTIGFANLDGSSGGELSTAGATMHFPNGVAIDDAAGRLYWANDNPDTISYAKLDGSGGGDLTTTGATTSSPQFPILIETPKTTGTPTITGGGTPGSTLACSSVTWGSDMPSAFLWRAPLSFGYQWTLDGTDIAGATQSSYTALQPGSYTCRAVAANEAGTTSVTSAPHAITGPAGTTNTTGGSPSGMTATPPALSKVSQSHRRWREGKALPHIAAARTPVGTVFRFTLNTGARVRFAFSQRTRSRGALSFTGHTGLNKVSFQGRLSRTRKLKPGTYTLTITATNTAGHASARLTLTIVK